MNYYVSGTEGGPVTGSGMTPDGTYPAGAIPCTQYTHDNQHLFVIQSGAAVISNALQLAKAKGDKLIEVNGAYLETTTANIEYMSSSFQTDAASINTMAQVLAGSASGLPEDFYWVDATNAHVPMTLAQLQGLGSAIVSRNWGAFKTLQDKKSLIALAATIEDVNAI
ncbi:MAG: DUF4376 domain-containing protein [Methylobacter sp.]